MATSKTETNDRKATPNAADEAAWMSIEGQMDRMKQYNDRLGEVSEEMMTKGFAAFESLTRLTRDNIAASRVIAKEWRDLGVETIRRQADLMTPSWLR